MVRWELACLWALMALGTGLGHAASFTGIREAKIDFRNGVPRLCLDGKATLPLVFFHNTDIPGEASDRYLRQQVALARDAGVHLYSLPFRCPRKPDGVTPNYEHSDGLLRRFIEVDPEALFILRVYPGPNWSWREWKQMPEEEFERFADGSKGTLSIGSESFRKGSNEELAQLVAHYEASEYGVRIIAWQPGGPSHEMFPLHYREKGPDYSSANQRGFREWLKRKYQTNDAIRKAWSQPEVTLEDAAIPEFEPERFPMRMGAGGSPVQVFYEIPDEQDWIDFSAYASDIAADRIIEWARIVKERTQGRKLTAFFYGYTFDLPGSLSGHYRLSRVLACPDVDILASPYSYADRFAGGAGNFMCPVDSIVAHGKLWFNEDDTRTNVIDTTNMPEHFTLFDRKCEGLDETLGVLGRNLGSIIVHRAATWWMDLVSRGAFNHPALWDMLAERRELYSERYRQPEPYRPEVAVIVDEESKLYVKDDWDANWWLMYRLRDESVKSGASIGYYTLDDFIGGVVPECRVYLFANAFYLEGAEIEKTHARLSRERATAIWVYAPGYLGPNGADVRRVRKAARIEVEANDGELGSRGEGLLDGETWGPSITVSPRLVVVDEGATRLGRYRADGLVSAAETTAGGHRSVLLCDWGPSGGVLRRLFESAGCHIWTRGGEVVQTDGSVLVIHSATGGPKSVSLPPGIVADPISHEVAGRDETAIHVPFEPGETVWFRLGRR